MTAAAGAAANPRVALVAVDEDDRVALARYLRRAGFDVHDCAELAVPRRFGALILLAADHADDATTSQVRSWLRLTRDQRVVVVTSKPAALRELAMAYGGRLSVMPAPAFGWELVDALRTTAPPEPPGA